ncbi:MAG: glycosyltransferase [candidate division Zixibacteria bacterium]|nr:glycosyltransferase [candidate division Zixibacteria bacterium]
MSRRPHLLMIPYYFPPLGMGGVQRPLKFARYLPEFGWDVTVMTAEPGAYPATDESLLAELPGSVTIERVRAWDPSRLQNRSDRTDRSYLPSLRDWFRFPDSRRAFVGPAVRRALVLAAVRPFDAVWTSSPPPSVHLVGLRLKRELGIPWVADFRDPWFARFNDWGPTRWHARYSKSLRARITSSADRVITASNAIAASLSKCCTPPAVITNGYDESDFAPTDALPSGTSPFTILLYGTFGENPDPEPIFNLLGHWARQVQNRQFCIQHLGAALGIDVPAIAARHGLQDRFTSLGYRSHHDSIRVLQSADLIALPQNGQPEYADILPGRVFEILRSLRPILLLADPGCETARLLDSLEGCWIARQDDVKAGIAALDSIAALPRYKPVRSVSTISRFDRRAQTGQLAAILDELRGKPSAGAAR